MTFVLGLDSGGTKTLAAIADASGRVLKQWAGPGFDPIAGDQWRGELANAVALLCDGQKPVAAVLGLPCHGEVESISETQRQTVRAIVDCQHLVLNDVEVACDGAFAGGDGVLLLAGTGSMAWAKVDGESLRVGGWGEAFGDEGSAFWIGRMALSLASQALDGRRNGHDFAEAILDTCGVDASHLIAWAYDQPNGRARFAALAERVSALADAGNITAIDLLKSAARALADHGEAARQRLERPSLAWSYAGGVFRSRIVREEVAMRLGSPVLAKLPPVGGALWRAAKLADWDSGPQFIAALGNSLEDFKNQKGNT